MSIKQLFIACSQTNEKDYGLTIMRIALGVFFFYHGAQKVMGWFGWPGLEGAIGFLTNPEGLAIPLFIAYLVAFGEFLWGIAMVLGLRVRPVAGAFIIILLWAIGLVHFQQGFTGYELHILAIAISIGVLLNGWWAFALDTKIKKFFD